MAGRKSWRLRIVGGDGARRGGAEDWHVLHKNMAELSADIKRVPNEKVGIREMVSLCLRLIWAVCGGWDFTGSHLKSQQML